MSRKTLLEKLQYEYGMLAINCEKLNTFIVSVEKGSVKSYNSLDKLCAQYDAMVEYSNTLYERIKELYADEGSR